MNLCDRSLEHSKQETIGSVDLSGILMAGLETLAAVGQTEAACRLAGRACAALRGTDPAGWRRFNVLLHRLTKHVS